MKVLLSLGSNVGDRNINITNAIGKINGCGRYKNDVKVLKSSSYYETAPWGVKDQADFLNSALPIETQTTIESLFLFLKTIEKDLGRKDSLKWGPRLIDIDILLCGDDMILDSDTLKIPHPHMNERAFVLVPLSEIAPDAVHPRTGKTAQELLNDLGDTSSEVKKYCDPPDVENL